MHVATPPPPIPQNMVAHGSGQVFKACSEAGAGSGNLAADVDNPWVMGGAASTGLQPLALATDTPLPPPPPQDQNSSNFKHNPIKVLQHMLYVQMNVETNENCACPSTFKSPCILMTCSFQWRKTSASRAISSLA